MMSRLAQSRYEVEQHFAGSSEWRYFSPAILRQYQVIDRLIKRYAHGCIIDLGCGFAPYRHLVREVTVYHMLDVKPKQEVDFVADIQQMAAVPSGHYDTALCFEVLEHVPDTLAALQEIRRVLKPSGQLIFSVPFLSRLHELPHDYYRFTAYGIAHLLRVTGFELQEIVVRGGLVAFLGHQLSTALVTIGWHARLLRSITWLINKWLITRPLSVVDSWVGIPDLFPLGYVGVARCIPG